MKGKKTDWAPLEKMGLYRIFPIHRLPVSVGMKILFILMLIVVLGSFVTLRLSLRLIYDNIWREAQNKLHNDLKTARMMYDGALMDVDRVVDFTANRFFLMEGIESGGLEDLKVQLEKIRRDRGLDVFTLVDNEGVVILRTAAPYSVGDNVSNDPIVHSALSGHKASGTVVMTRERLKLEGEELVIRAHVNVKPTKNALPGALEVVDSGMLLMAAYPVYSRHGVKLGALYGARLLNNDTVLVDSIMAQMFPGSQEQINLAMVSIFFWDVRASTSLRFSNGNRAAGSLMYGEVSEAVLKNGQNWVGTSWVVQDWYFAAYEPIRDPDGKVIGSLGIGLWKSPFIAIRDNFVSRYVKISLVALAIVLVLGFIFSRMLTKPLRELAKASHELAKGKLDFRVKIKAGRDEIRELELAFNLMANNLNTIMQERQKLTDELRDLNDRYMELLGFASHEIKGPVGVIAVTVENLRKNGSHLRDDAFEKILDRLDRNVSYISSMSDKYLHYSKIESGQLKLYKTETKILSEIIEPAVEGEQKPILEKKMEVEIENAEEMADLTLYVDPEMTRVIFSNLISNAVKYGYQGGYIRIGCVETEESYVFNVKNNGEGIPPDEIGLIFKKFRRLESARKKQKGTGLGLFITREIVELHGGRIRAESEPGKWANFIFELPKSSVNPSVHDKGNKVQGEELWGY